MRLTQGIINVALRALATKTLTAAALLGDFVLFGWAVASGGWDRLAAAVLFAIATWCLVNLKVERKVEHGNETQA